MRLRAAKRLDERQSLLIEYAFYQCRPAARPQSRRKLRSPLHMYVRHLVCDLLSEESIQQVCVNHSCWMITPSAYEAIAFLHDLSAVIPAVSTAHGSLVMHKPDGRTTRLLEDPAARNRFQSLSLRYAIVYRRCLRLLCTPRADELVLCRARS